MAGDARAGLPPPALGALVRITTNRRSDREPSTAAEAFTVRDDLPDRRNGRVVEPGERRWPIFRWASTPARAVPLPLMLASPRRRSSGVASG